jgi:hypothetical protein
VQFNRHATLTAEWIWSTGLCITLPGKVLCLIKINTLAWAFGVGIDAACGSGRPFARKTSSATPKKGAATEARPTVDWDGLASSRKRKRQSDIDVKVNHGAVTLDGSVTEAQRPRLRLARVGGEQG